MKRKTVLRILSCALACTMLFETPLQAAAVTDGVNLQMDEDGVPAEDGGTEEQSIPDTEGAESDEQIVTEGEETAAEDNGNVQESENGEDTDNEDLETGAGDGTGTDGGSQTDESGDITADGEDEPSDASGEEGGKIQQEDPVDTSAPNISNSLPTAGADNGMPLQELRPTIQTGEFELSFDVQEENTFDPSGYEELTAVLAQTWTDQSTESVDVASKALSLDVVMDLLEYMIQTSEYDTSCLRPQVSYTYIIEDAGDVENPEAEDAQRQIIQTLTFSYLVLDAPEVSAEVHDFTGVSLNWSAVEGADAYEVYRTEKTEDDSLLAVSEEPVYRTEDGSGTLSWQDEGVLYGTDYVYQVAAVCSDGIRTYRSSLSEVTEICAKADAPANLQASGAGNAVELSWDSVEGATGYEVEVQDPATGEYTLLGTAMETSYLHEGLEYDASYTYRVRAVRQKQRDMAAYSGYTGAVEAQTEVPILEAVSLTAVSETWNQVQLTWQVTDASTGYEIERKADNGAYAKIADIQAGTASYTDTVEPGITYTYRIRPVKQLGSQTFYGDYSGEQPIQTALDTPSAVSVSASDMQSLSVSWSAVEGANGYEVYRSSSSGSGYTLVANLSGGEVQYRDTGLTIESTYYYQVRAYRTAAGKTVYSGYSSVGSGTVKLSQVTGLYVQMTKYNTLQLSWNASGDAKTYEVYYSTSPDSGYKRATSTKKTTYKFTKAKCGQTYYFKVRTYEKIGKVKYYSDYCAAVSGRTVLTGTPTVYVSKTKYNSVTIKWSKVPSTKKYEIYYSTSPDGEYTLLKSQGGTSYTHKNLTTGVTYYYKVRATRDYFYGEYSNVTSGRPVLGELKNLKVRTGTNQLKISWKSVSGAQAYVLMRSDSADGDYVEINRAKKTSYTDKGLQAGTTYYYKVYAVAGIYQTNTLGPIGEATKPPKQVTQPSKPSVEKNMYYGVDVSSYQGRIDWDEVADTGIDFAMIRILTGKRTSNLDKDVYFEYNYQHARAAGIKVGVYRYTYAYTKSGARQEATEIVDALGGRYLEYPIVLDLEDSMVLNSTTREKRTEIIQEYKKIVERAGYKFALYANKNWLENYIEPEALEGVDIWLARWRSLDQGPGYNGPGNLTMWQYTSSGSVNGISGNVDRNVSYKNYK